MAPPSRSDVGFDGGIAAGVEDFAGGDGDDLGHVAPGGDLGVAVVVSGDDAMVETVVELGAAVDGEQVAAHGANGVDEFDAGGLHLMDFSKGLYGGWAMGAEGLRTR